MLGVLRDLTVRGRWDYRLEAALDLAKPDSATFLADVLPHGLQIDSERTRLRIVGLEEPFFADIHLPKNRSTTRDLSPSNPMYRPLAEIDSNLVHAVLTNEDGGFFRHRGFNVAALKDAIGDNLRAGAFKRGAGTITMQLARNLYLGHERTLSRKGQEIVLAWVLEHLSGASKERLLEIYLNIIEWGPGVHGANEAARYYFGVDAGHLTIPEVLFLSAVIPSPLKWYNRLADDESLRPYVRDQMHFIGRMMIAKGWLTPEHLPPKEELNVVIAGAARLDLPPRILRARQAAADSAATGEPL
jgi:hypothetical protein